MYMSCSIKQIIKMCRQLQLPTPSMSSSWIYKLLLTLSWLNIICSQVNWSAYSQIRTGQIALYNGPSMFNSNTPNITYNYPFTATFASSNIFAAIGISKFNIPPTKDFSIITYKSLTSNNLQLKVDLQDNTVIYMLNFDVIVMARSGLVFGMRTKEFYPTVINQGTGYRSQLISTVPNTTTDPVFLQPDLQSTVVLQSFRIMNPTGNYIYLDTMVHFINSSYIDITVITAEDAQVHYFRISILVFCVSQADLTNRVIIQLGNIPHTNISNYLTNSLQGRYKTSNRMFFGLSSFNFSIINDKNFNFDSTAYSTLPSTYSLDNIQMIKLSYYWVVYRDNCTGGQYYYHDWNDPSTDVCVTNCTGYSDRPNHQNVYMQCRACHPTCLTCNGTNSNTCLTCNTNNNRTFSSGLCSCIPNHVAASSLTPNCLPCNAFMPGCLSCSSPSNCTSCMAGFSGTTVCTCPSALVSGYCNTVYGCSSISMINNTQTCTSCYTSLYLQLAANFTCVCVYGTIKLANYTCKIICGDNYVMSAEACDDGNLVAGDGCDQWCRVEQYWSCQGVLAQGSTCKIDTLVTIQYIGTLRNTQANQADLYYKLSPQIAQLSALSYNHLITTTIPSTILSTSYTSPYLKISLQYHQHLQGTTHTLLLNLTNSHLFWNPTNELSQTIYGINAQLTIDDGYHWMHNIMKYLVIGLVASSYILLIVSCIWYQKWIGLQLIQTYQTIYFIFSMAHSYPYQLTSLTQYLKYTTGFSSIMSTPYTQNYPLSSALIALGIHKQFITNFNVMYIVLLVILAVLAVTQAVKRYYKRKLEETVSSNIKKKFNKAEKVFSWVFSKVWLMIVFFSMQKIIFCFAVQLATEQQAYQRFADELNVVAGLLAFVLVFGMLSFILYWTLLLPQTHSQQKQFIHLQFQQMHFFYPLFYLFYQTLQILLISILFSLTLTPYLVLSLQFIYLISLIIIRPYNTIRKYNRYLHNITIIINQSLTIIVTIIVIRWNSIHRSLYQRQSRAQIIAYFWVIAIIMIVVAVLAVIRLAVFQKEFNCCRKEDVYSEQNGIKNNDSQSFRKIQKQRNGTLLNHQEKPLQMTMIQPSHQRRKTPSNYQKKSSLYSQYKGNKNPQYKQNKPTKTNQISLQKRKRKISNQQQIHINQNVLNQFLNEDHIKWNKDKIYNDDDVPKVTRRNIKKTTNEKKAEMKKTSLQIYMELKDKRMLENSAEQEQPQHVSFRDQQN